MASAGKFGLLFKFNGSAEDGYLFIRNIGNGIQSYVQLVKHIKTGELRVRKVCHKRITEREHNRPNTEVEVDRSLATLPPFNHALLLEYEDVPYDNSGSHNPRWYRTSYWRFYSAGSLKAFMSTCYVIPPAVIARCVWQVLEGLQIMYSNNMVRGAENKATYRTGTTVLHRDLHEANIFVNLSPDTNMVDFYIGDFGLSVVKELLPPNPSASQYPPLFEVRPPWDVTRFAEVIRKLIGRFPPTSNTIKPLREIMILIDARNKQDHSLRNLKGNDGPFLPLDDLVQMAKAAESHFIQEDWLREDSIKAACLKAVQEAEADKLKEPLTFESHQEALGNSPKAQENRPVHGPFYLVDLSDPTKMVVDSTPHNRPKYDRTSGSDTDQAGSVWAQMQIFSDPKQDAKEAKPFPPLKTLPSLTGLGSE